VACSTALELEAAILGSVKSFGFWAKGVADAKACRPETDEDVCCEAASSSVLMVWTKAWSVASGAVVFGLCDIGMGTICSVDGAWVVAGAESCEMVVVGALILPGNIACERRVPIEPVRWALLEELDAMCSSLEIEGTAVVWPVIDVIAAVEVVAFELCSSASPVGLIATSWIIDSIIALMFSFLA
jgi:hypothetical protein